MVSYHSFSAPVGKRQRRVDEESDGADMSREINGTATREAENDRIQSVSNSLKSQRTTGEGRGPDESISNTLRKRRRKTEDGSSPYESIDSPLDTQGTKTQERNGPAERKRFSLKIMKKRREERTDLDENFINSLNQGRKETREGSSSDEHINNLQQEWRTSDDEEESDAEDKFNDSDRAKHDDEEELDAEDRFTDSDRAGFDEEEESDAEDKFNDPDRAGHDEKEESDAEDKFNNSDGAGHDEEDESDAEERDNNSDRAGHEIDTDFLGASSEEFEELEIIPHVDIRKVVRKAKKKYGLVDMTSVDGMWARSLTGPHLDLMVSLKQLAEVRLTNTGEKSLSSCLTPASLRTIGIILEEQLKDRMKLMEENRDVQPKQDEYESSLQVDRVEQAVDSEDGIPLSLGGAHQSK